MQQIPNKDLYGPETNPHICIGCGACEHVCPARPKKAIIVIPNTRQIQIINNLNLDHPPLLVGCVLPPIPTSREHPTPGQCALSKTPNCRPGKAGHAWPTLRGFTWT